MHDPKSAQVVAVSLNRRRVSTSKLSSIDLVARPGIYWHPVTKQFKGAPEYLAFYYDKKLQSIHHVDDVEEVARTKDSRLLKRHRVKAPKFTKPTLVIKVGPAVQPLTEILVGQVWAGQEMPCSLLHLLTSATIKAAWKTSAAERRAA